MHPIYNPRTSNQIFLFLDLKPKLSYLGRLMAHTSKVDHSEDQSRPKLSKPIVNHPYSALKAPPHHLNDHTKTHYRPFHILNKHAIHANLQARSLISSLLPNCSPPPPKFDDPYQGSNQTGESYGNDILHDDHVLIFIERKETQKQKLFAVLIFIEAYHQIHNSH